ncbi:hypothetical protein HCU40_02655 [Pseudanabaena biceps]|nr:hypothetical protein [Pseudanabaena biceps]
MKTSKRPLLVTILATTMIVVSLIMICDRLLAFSIYRSAVGNLPLADSNSINLQLVSGLAILGFGTVPILLAIGLWNLKSWARFISLCLFSSVMFPAIAASLKWISPPSAAKLLEIPTIFDDALTAGVDESVSRLMLLNPYLAIGNAIAIGILLTPAIDRAFRKNAKIDES